MLTNRRQFITRSAVGGLGLMTMPLIASGPVAGAATSRPNEPGIIATHARYFRYSPGRGPSEEIAWINIDLGAIRPIDAVRIRPASASALTPDHAPVDYCVACSVDSAFQGARPFALWRAEYSAEPQSSLARFRAKRMNAQFIRIEASAATERDDALLPSGPGAIEILSDGAAVTVNVHRWSQVRRGMASSATRGRSGHLSG